MCIGERTPRATLTLVIHRKNGERVEVPVTCRLDTAEEVSIYDAGGVLQRFAQDFLASAKAALEDDHGTRSRQNPAFPATYMRGGTSKGVFFRLQDLPASAQVPGKARDALLLRVIGSPDPYGKQIDGMGGATSSTSKTVILSKSSRPITMSTTCSARSRSTGLLSTGAATAATSPRPWARSRSATAWSIRARAARRHRRAHLAGEHRQDHRLARADDRRRCAGDRRLRTRRRDLPGRRGRARIHGPGRRRKKARGGAMFPTGNWSMISRCPVSAC
jgi:hypothetical protein